MTNQCKFDMENYLFIPLAIDTCVSVMRGMKLSILQKHRLQRKRTKYSTVRSNWKDRICAVGMKTDTDAANNRINCLCLPGVISAACEESHIYGKSGDLVVSMNMPRKEVE